MIVYAVPNGGIHGGIKVAYQTVDALCALGVSACIATPDGLASQWFRSNAPVLSRAEALAQMSEDDLLVFSLPHDYSELRATGHQLVFHCQGTDPLIDPVIRDERVEVLTCWQQAAEYVEQRAGRESTDVGIQIADDFYHRGEEKDALAVAFMPRRGKEIALHIAGANPALRAQPIDGLSETQVAMRLRRSSAFIASSVGEGFGLPALEAMAAGCVVLSVPVVGGEEFLSDGENCFYGDTETLCRAASLLIDPAAAPRLAKIRYAAIATALSYRPALSRQKLARWVGSLSLAARQPFVERLSG